MLTGLFVLAILIMRLFPQTPAARTLHLYVVELPMALAARLERRHLLFLTVGMVMLYGFALTLPLDIAMLGALDMTAFVDVALAVSASALLARGRAVGAALRASLPRRRIARTRGPARAGRAPRRARPARAVNDDEDRPARRSA